MTTEDWDLIVVGGGAAGFFAAITCAEASHSRVLIVEKSPNVLGKVKISGGGRCNVTHSCFEPKALTGFYPRGGKSLIGPFHRWGATDTVGWFQSRGVELKTEADGRMFPVTDTSQTVIDCLTESARSAGVELQVSTGISNIHHEETGSFQLLTSNGKTLNTRSVLLATGGTRLAAGAKLAESLGHKLISNVPSLFAFNISDPRISELPGISVSQTEVSVEGMKLSACGPLLITHHGLSGPGVLKLSAWGARELHDGGYDFHIKINWLPGLTAQNIESTLTETRQTWGKRRVRGRAPFDPIPKRLWDKLCEAAEVAEDTIWSQLTKESARKLLTELTSGRYHVSGKSINKDEFVTCGGVNLNEVNLKTMESKVQPGLYFAGEILNVDGITGGFNFQNAWTSGHLAGMAVAES
ncbi:flavoprotein [Oceaniferula spumae]|uniref:Flavoprotein n=1 Tax=Oceaniferula spumae TaxID=2979115 RepID=A0AAT9FR27_9BACT